MSGKLLETGSDAEANVAIAGQPWRQAVAPFDRHDSEDEETEPALPDPYEIVSIRAVPPPGGAAGASWYRYEISQGGNRIVGYREGGIDKVTLAVEAIVLQSNERRRHRRGRVHVVLQPRSGVAKPGTGR